MPLWPKLMVILVHYATYIYFVVRTIVIDVTTEMCNLLQPLKGALMFYLGCIHLECGHNYIWKETYIFDPSTVNELTIINLYVFS